MSDRQTDAVSVARTVYGVYGTVIWYNMWYSYRYRTVFCLPEFCLPEEAGGQLVLFELSVEC